MAVLPDHLIKLDFTMVLLFRLFMLVVAISFMYPHPGASQPGPESPGYQDENPDLEAFARALTAVFNEARAESRMCGDEYMPAARPVQWDEDLARAARVHSEDMSKNGFRGHQGSDGSSPTDRIRRITDRFYGAAEILAFGGRSPEAAVFLWLRSPGHCRILMGEQYAFVGAYAIHPEYRPGNQWIYWTAKFARNPVGGTGSVRNIPELNRAEQMRRLHRKKVTVYVNYDDPRAQPLLNDILSADNAPYTYNLNDAAMREEADLLRQMAQYGNARPAFALVLFENRVILDPENVNELLYRFENDSRPLLPEGHEKLAENRVFMWGPRDCESCAQLEQMLRIGGNRPVRYYTDDARSLEYMWSKVTPAGAYTVDSNGDKVVAFPVAEIAGQILTGDFTLSDLIQAVE